MKQYQNKYQDETVKRAFTPFPMVSYGNARKSSRYLVCAKIYPLEQKRGFCKCGSSIYQVRNNIEETETFSSTVTGKTSKINHNLCCNDKCLIYFLTKCLIFLKFVVNNILAKQLISLDCDGTTIKIMTGHF